MANWGGKYSHHCRDETMYVLNKTKKVTKNTVDAKCHIYSDSSNLKQEKISFFFGQEDKEKNYTFKSEIYNHDFFYYTIYYVKGFNHFFCVLYCLC